MRFFPCFRLALLPFMSVMPITVAQAQTEFTGAGQHNELDCDGGSIHVAGADNRLVIRGACSALHVQGASNEISIDMAARSSIRVEGASNIIRWTAPPAARPKLSISGADNRVSRVR